MRSLIRFIRYIRILAVFALVTACDDSTSPSGAAPESIEIMQGNAQAGRVGEELSQQLVVRILDHEGSPVGGTFVLWVGDGTPWVDVTDTASDGITRNYWSLGNEPGPQRLELWGFDVETGKRGKFLGSLSATAQP